MSCQVFSAVPLSLSWEEKIVRLADFTMVEVVFSTHMKLQILKVLANKRFALKSRRYFSGSG